MNPAETFDELPPGYAIRGAAPAEEPDDLPPGYTIRASSLPAGENMGFGTRSDREAEPSREQRIAGYEEAERGRQARQGETAMGRVMGGVDTFARGLARAVPFRDDLAATVQTVTGLGKGADRQENLDRERARNRVMDEEAPVASYGGQLAGGLALPGAGVASSGLRGGLAVGGGYGALQGASQGDTLAERAGNAATGGLVGGALGGPLGAAAARFAPGAASAGTGRVQPNAIVTAGDELGMTVPRAVASDSRAVQALGSRLSGVPLAGRPLAREAERTVTQLGERADDVVSRLGGGVDAEGAGATASGSITGWIKDGSRKRVSAAYDEVDRFVQPGVKTDLAETRGIVASIAAERDAGALPAGSAIGTVLDAVQRPGGLSYAGVKALRTRVGEMLDSGILPADTSKAELGRLYGALSSDLRSSVANAGGPQALAKFERANTYSRLVSERRQTLQQLVGKDGDAAPAMVFSRLARAAGTTAKADTQLLLKARKVMGDDWQDVQSAVVSRMGRRGDDAAFDPKGFVADYGKLSPQGKAVLFGGSGQGDLAKSLDAIATVSKRMAPWQGAMPSTLRQALVGSGVGGGLGTGMIPLPDSVMAIRLALGANVASRILAAPATAKSAATWARVYEQAVRKPSRGAGQALAATSRQFGASIGEELGLPVGEVTRALQSMTEARAEGRPQ